MNTCAVDLYDLIGFAESDNAIFDDMGVLLSSYSAHKTSFALSAPFNPATRVDLKLPLSESLALAAKSSRPVYAAVKYEDGEESKTFYYFVEDAKRLANKTVALSMKMDTLNSYNLNGKLAPTCYITREHADRFAVARVSSGVISVHNAIDKSDEGYAPALYKTADTPVLETTHNMDYYLVYKTRDDITQSNLTNPISCYLCPHEAVKAIAGGSGPVVTLTPNDISASAHLYLDSDAAAWEVEADGSTYKSGDVMYVNNEFGLSSFLAVIKGVELAKADATYIKGSLLLYYPPVGTFFRTASGVAVSDVTLTKVKEYYSIGITTNQKADYFGKNTVTVNSGTVSDVYSKAFSAVDRSDSKLIKIIDLPYCPVSKAIASDGTWSFSGFSFVPSLGYWKENDVSASFLSSLPIGAIASEFTTALLDQFDDQGDKTDFLTLPHFVKDPKRYNSGFYALKLSYDTFSLAYALETLAFEEPDASEVQIALAFKATNTINSNFLFTVSFNNMSVNGQTDYPNMLISTRNNEVPIFTNDYINYLKTGYNYDKKAKALSAASSFLSAGLSIATGVGAAVAGAATGNPITAAAGVSLIGSGVAGISSAITSTIASENSFASKIASLQAQATSTAGSDDLDLLKSYNGNRLRVMRYEASDEAMALFDDLFRAFGYKRAKYGAPNMTSRSWYNFAAASIVLSKDAGEIPADVLEDETGKWANGVTVYHLPLGPLVGYDIERSNENWEVALVSAAFPE